MGKIEREIQKRKPGVNRVSCVRYVVGYHSSTPKVENNIRKQQKGDPSDKNTGCNSASNRSVSQKCNDNSERIRIASPDFACTLW